MIIDQDESVTVDSETSTAIRVLERAQHRGTVELMAEDRIMVIELDRHGHHWKASLTNL